MGNVDNLSEQHGHQLVAAVDQLAAAVEKKRQRMRSAQLNGFLLFF